MKRKLHLSSNVILCTESKYFKLGDKCWTFLTIKAIKPVQQSCSVTLMQYYRVYIYVTLRAALLKLWKTSLVLTSCSLSQVQKYSVDIWCPKSSVFIIFFFIYSWFLHLCCLLLIWCWVILFIFFFSDFKIKYSGGWPPEFFSLFQSVASKMLRSIAAREP